MKENIKAKLTEIVGQDWVVSNPEIIKTLCSDEAEIKITPCYDCIAAKPATAAEVAAIVKLANEEGIAVIARGGATGLVNAVVPIQPTIIISMERFKKIIEVDESNLTVECEAGVTLLDLVEYFNSHPTLYFAAHPGDEGAQVGGMIATNAGGVRTIKYGVVRDQVKSMEVVLPTGEIINMGGKFIKDNCGYDLKDLIIGSEGTLGIITKAVLALQPKEKYTGSVLIAFNTTADAVACVPDILKRGIKPLAVEYVERIQATNAATDIGQVWPVSKGSDDLYLIIASNSEDEFYEICETIVEICDAHNAVETLICETAKEQRNILEIRSHVYPSMLKKLVDCLDMAVPPDKIPAYMEQIRALSQKYGVEIQTCAHIGDGNMHNNIMTPDGQRPDCYEDLLDEIIQLCMSCNGTLTGEHGVGKLRNRHMKLQFTEKELELMRAIKKIFDPNNILNPGTAIC